MGREKGFPYGCCRHKQYNDDAELELLADMLWYADMAYEGESERTLSQRLGMRGGHTACGSKVYPPCSIALLHLTPCGTDYEGDVWMFPSLTSRKANAG